MKHIRNTPCNECPFLTKYKRGFTLQRLIQLALTDMPCHKTCTVDEDGEDADGLYIEVDDKVKQQFIGKYIK